MEAPQQHEYLRRQWCLPPETKHFTTHEGSKVPDIFISCQDLLLHLVVVILLEIQPPTVYLREPQRELL